MAADDNSNGLAIEKLNSAATTIKIVRIDVEKFNRQAGVAWLVTLRIAGRSQ